MSKLEEKGLEQSSLAVWTLAIVFWGQPSNSVPCF
jgi:hypothetical protein